MPISGCSPGRSVNRRHGGRPGPARATTRARLDMSRSTILLRGHYGGAGHRRRRSFSRVAVARAVGGACWARRRGDGVDGQACPGTSRSIIGSRLPCAPTGGRMSSHCTRTRTCARCRTCGARPYRLARHRADRKRRTRRARRAGRTMCSASTAVRPPRTSATRTACWRRRPILTSAARRVASKRCRRRMPCYPTIRRERGSMKSGRNATMTVRPHHTNPGPTPTALPCAWWLPSVRTRGACGAELALGEWRTIKMPFTAFRDGRFYAFAEEVRHVYLLLRDETPGPFALGSAASSPAVASTRACHRQDLRGNGAVRSAIAPAATTTACGWRVRGASHRRGVAAASRLVRLSAASLSTTQT